MIKISSPTIQLFIIGLSIHVSILHVCFAETRPDTPFEITLGRREREENFITLGCLQGGVQVEDAVYFNNDSRVETISEVYAVINGQLMFVISRDLEGIYTCGNESGPMSNGLRLIGL